MARDFDGANDRISFGSDTSIDNFALKSMSMWYEFDALPTACALVIKDAFNSTWQWIGRAANGKYNIVHAFTVTHGEWQDNEGLHSLNQRYHGAMIYDRNSVLNDPEAWLDGVALTFTEVSTPVGTASSDAADNLLIGEAATGVFDLDGRIQHFCFDDRTWTAEQRNRAMWWGRPDGAIKVYHPLLTTKLANEGTATANGSATGTTVAAFATPVVRPGSAMMGMGVGW